MQFDRLRHSMQHRDRKHHEESGYDGINIHSNVHCIAELTVIVLSLNPWHGRILHEFDQ